MQNFPLDKPVQDSHVLRYRAHQIADAVNSGVPVYRIEDRWGGYWQMTTKDGQPYNFRT